MAKPFFMSRLLVALTISVIADAIDFAEGPILGIPPIGAVSNAVVTGILYAITRNKKSATINATKFIPFIGDFIPTYTITAHVDFQGIEKDHSKYPSIRKKLISGRF